eukprot:711940-Pyramimonas_sp.AAC.1
MDPQRCRLCAQAGPSDRRGCADPRVLRCRCRAGAAAHRGDGDEPRVEPVAHYIALRDGGQEQSGLRAAHLHPRLSKRAPPPCPTRPSCFNHSWIWRGRSAQSGWARRVATASRRAVTSTSPCSPSACASARCPRRGRAATRTTCPFATPN